MVLAGCGLPAVGMPKAFGDWARQGAWQIDKARATISV
jgi:hypothetical protein